MEDHLEHTYRDKLGPLKVDPSGRIWDQLEKRLDQDQGKVPKRLLWKWSMAAATIAALIIAFALHSRPQVPVMVFEELESMPKATFTAYKYAHITNQIYHGWNWKGIAEGEMKQLAKSRNNSIIPSQKSLHVAPAKGSSY